MPGDQIIFNGPDKSEEDLRSAIQNGSLIHIDHLDELYTLANIWVLGGVQSVIHIMGLQIILSNLLF